MHVNLNYEAVSLFFAVLIFLNHCFSYTDGSVLNKTFRSLALLNILATAADIGAILDMTRFVRIHFFSTVLTAGRLMLYGWMSFIFSVYIDNLLKRRESINIFYYIRKGLTILFTCAAVFNMVTGTFYTIADGQYVRTPLFPVLLVVPFSMLLYTAVITLAHTGKLTTAQTIPAFASMIVIFAGAWLQAEVFPQVELTGTAVTICLLIILFTLEAPERQKFLEVLEVYHEDLEKNIREKTAEISIVQNGIINGLADLISGRDPSESNHARRCAYVVQLITDRMRQEDLSPKKQKFFDDVVKAAPLHDIGDEATIEELFDPEINIIRQILGDCSDDDFIRVTENMVRYHRMRYDGIGAVDNNIGEFIPLEARIMAIAEAFDDYISESRAKGEEREKEIPVPVAMKRIWDEAGTVFDPALIKYIFACRDGLTAYYQENGHAV